MGCRELENLESKMKLMLEEMVIGYDILLELNPEEENKYLEKKIMDIAVS